MTKKKVARKKIAFTGWVAIYGGSRELFNDSAGKPRFTPVYSKKKQATAGLYNAVRVRVTEIK